MARTPVARGGAPNSSARCRIGSNSTILRRYGPPSAVRVVCELAMFSAIVSMRMRSAVRPEEEMYESLKTIADSVAVAMELAGIKPDLWFGKIEKKKSKQPELHSSNVSK